MSPATAGQIYGYGAWGRFDNTDTDKVNNSCVGFRCKWYSVCTFTVCVGTFFSLHLYSMCGEFLQLTVYSVAVITLLGTWTCSVVCWQWTVLCRQHWNQFWQVWGHPCGGNWWQPTTKHWECMWHFIDKLPFSVSHSDFLQQQGLHRPIISSILLRSVYARS